MSKSTQELLEESIARGKDDLLDTLKETVVFLKGWVDELRQEKAARLEEWTTLAELRPGAIFETEQAERGVKMNNTDAQGRPQGVVLGTGARLSWAGSLKVREVQIP